MKARFSMHFEYLRSKSKKINYYNLKKKHAFITNQTKEQKMIYSCKEFKIAINFIVNKSVVGFLRFFY